MVIAFFDYKCHAADVTSLSRKPNAVASERPKAQPVIRKVDDGVDLILASEGVGQKCGRRKVVINPLARSV